MMKFVLGLIAILIVSLVLYIIVESNGKQQVPQEVNEEVLPKEQVLETVPKAVTSKKVTHSKSKMETPKQKETSAKDTVPSAQYSMKIDVTELAVEGSYEPDVEPTSDELVSEEEWSSIEKQMIESGQISQENDFSTSVGNLGYNPLELADKPKTNKKDEK
jgi:hypothetical protein